MPGDPAATARLEDVTRKQQAACKAEVALGQDALQKRKFDDAVAHFSGAEDPARRPGGVARPG